MNDQKTELMHARLRALYASPQRAAIREAIDLMGAVGRADAAASEGTTAAAALLRVYVFGHGSADPMLHYNARRWSSLSAAQRGLVLAALDGAGLQLVSSALNPALPQQPAALPAEAYLAACGQSAMQVFSDGVRNLHVYQSMAVGAPPHAVNRAMLARMQVDMCRGELLGLLAAAVHAQRAGLLAGVPDALLQQALDGMQSLAQTLAQMMTLRVGGEVSVWEHWRRLGADR